MAISSIRPHPLPLPPFREKGDAAEKQHTKKSPLPERGRDRVGEIWRMKMVYHFIKV